MTDVSLTTDTDHFRDDRMEEPVTIDGALFRFALAAALFAVILVAALWFFG